MLKILGVMTGTSCDALDAACISFDESSKDSGPGSIKTLWYEQSPYPKPLRSRVLQAQKPGAKLSSLDWLELNRDLGLWYAQTLNRLIRKHRAGSPDLIANHGQTIAHFPKKAKMGCTLQLGDPARISYATGLTVVSHFRDGDMSAGGQGAPLAPGFHLLLARFLDPKRQGCAVHNIGGISNFTYVGKEIFAFDTGPGNIWIDAATELATNGKMKFDRDGKIGRQGQPDLRAVREILRNPYFKLSFPKSTGRDDFPFEALRAKCKAVGADLVATATEVTAASIAMAYEDSVLKRGLPLHSVHVVGGGAKNPTLMNRLSELLSPTKIVPLSIPGQDPQWIEAQAFAYFGALSLLGQPLGGTWTGAHGFAPPGQITPGRNWPHLLKKIERKSNLKRSRSPS